MEYRKRKRSLFGFVSVVYGGRCERRIMEYGEKKGSVVVVMVVLKLRREWR